MGGGLLGCSGMLVRARSPLLPRKAMQRKNVIQFLIAAALFIAGLQFLQRQFFKPGPVPEKQDAEPVAEEKVFGLLPRSGSPKRESSA